MKLSIRDVLSLNFVHRRATVVISGSVNSDRNALARALGMKAEREGVSVMTINAGILDKDSGAAEAAEISTMRRVGVAKPKLLIIEDVGVKKLAPAQAKLFARLVSERLNKVSLIITSLRPLSAWAAQLGPSAGAKSLLKSLSVHAGQVVIGTKDQALTDNSAKRRPAPSARTAQAHT